MLKNAVKALIWNDKSEILVLFRSETHPHLAHDIDLPGGEIDDDHSLEETLSREIKEETGLIMKANPDQLIHSWVEFWGTRQYLYDLEANSADKVVISWEHKSYSWMTIEEFVSYPAKDEFMHRAQEWLRAQNSQTLEKLIVSAQG